MAFSFPKHILADVTPGKQVLGTRGRVGHPLIRISAQSASKREIHRAVLG